MPPLLLRAALLLGSIALIQPPHPLVAQKSTPVTLDIPFRRFVLPNGLTVIVHARIIEALRRNDRTAAADRLTHHWERGIEELGSWLER